MVTATSLLTYLLQTVSLFGSHFHHTEVNLEEAQCLAENIYFEARGESEHGQLAVANVTLNRVRHPDYPDTVCDVVRQKTRTKRNGNYVCAFSWYCENRRIRFTNKDGSINHKTVEQFKAASVIALTALYNPPGDNTKGAISFHNPHASSPGWAQTMRRTVRIGNHDFYASKMHKQ